MRILCLLPLILLLVSRSALAENEDLIQQKLKAARKEFEQAHKQARTGLLEDLKKKEVAFQKAGNLEKVVQMQEELEKFEEDGTLPSAVSTRVYENLMKRAALKLDAVYGAIIRQYTMAGDIDRAKELQEELQTLKTNHGNPARPAQITLHNAGAIGKLTFGELVFSNRDYQWSVYPAEIKDWSFTLHPIRQPKEYEFTVEKEGVLYICFGNFENLQNEQPFLDNGWEKVATDEEVPLIFMKATLKKGKYRLPIGHPHSGTMVIYKPAQ